MCMGMMEIWPVCMLVNDGFVGMAMAMGFACCYLPLMLMGVIMVVMQIVVGMGVVVIKGYMLVLMNVVFGNGKVGAQ